MNSAYCIEFTMVLSGFDRLFSFSSIFFFFQLFQHIVHVCNFYCCPLTFYLAGIFLDGNTNNNDPHFEGIIEEKQRGKQQMQNSVA